MIQYMSKTIGVLTNHMGGAKLPYERGFALAVADVARQQGSRVIYYTGGFYNVQTMFEGRHSFIFDLIRSDKPDGLIALSSTLANSAPGKICTRFILHLRQSPSSVSELIFRVYRVFSSTIILP